MSLITAGTVKIWDTATGFERRVLSGHERGIACLQYSKGYVVTGSSDKTIRIWDVEKVCW